MKKITLTIVMIMAILLSLNIVVFAEDDVEIIAVEKEASTEAETVEKSVAEQAGDWVSKYVDKIVVILAAIYAVFPKVGLLPVLISTISKINSHFNKNDPDSFQNILVANANTISAFMNDLAPIIEDVRSGNKDTKDVLAAIAADKEQANAAIEACRQSIVLMAKELNDLISCSTTISAKTKARFENEWASEIQKINALSEPEKANDGDQ